MTSYNVEAFLFRFIICPHCKQEYHYTDDGSGIDFDEPDYILWSCDIPAPHDPLEHLHYVSMPDICKCTSCQSIIWNEEGVNTHCKRMENSEVAWATLNSSSRPGHLSWDELLTLSEDVQLSEAQQIKALRYFMGSCNYEYMLYFGSSEEITWPPTPAFFKSERLLPYLSSVDVIDQFDKAELLRNLGRFSEARQLLKQVEDRNYKRIANYLIGICRKEISRPVIIPPRFRVISSFKRWLNSKRPGTFKRLKKLKIEDYF